MNVKTATNEVSGIEIIFEKLSGSFAFNGKPDICLMTISLGFNKSLETV